MPGVQHRGPIRGLFLALLGVFASGEPVGARSEELELRVSELVFRARAAGPADGELVLLLHGFPQTSHSFRHQLAALGAAGYRAVAPDQRGYSPGARPASVASYALPELVGDVLGMADSLGRRHFHLVGHDWGGAVAWAVAARHPERLLTLTVLSTPHPAALSAARSDPASDQAARSSYMKRFAEPGSEVELLADDAAGLRRVLAGLAPEEVQVYVEALGTPAALRGALNWYSALGARPSGGPERAGERSALATLYVWSTEDPVLGRDAAERTRAFAPEPYRFEILAGIGHWIPEQAPERLNELLLSHLEASRAPANR